MGKVEVLRTLDFRLYVDNVLISRQDTRRRQLIIEQGYIDTSTMGGSQGPDPAWTHLDAAGHWHAVAQGGAGRKDKELWYPTLVRQRGEEYYCTDCQDTHEGNGFWACVICGEEIAPAMRYEPGKRERLPAGAPEWRIELTVNREGMRALIPSGNVLAASMNPRPVSVRMVTPAAVSAAASGQTRMLFGAARLRIESFTGGSDGVQEITAVLNGMAELGTRARSVG